MKALTLLLILGLSAQAFATSEGLPQPAAVKNLLNYGGGEGIRAAQLGTQVIDKKIQLMKANYSYAVQGGSTAAAINLKDVDGKDAVLPDNAVIKRVMFDVITGASTSLGAATISFGANTATDLKAATNVAGVWQTAGLIEGIPTGSAALSVKTTAKRTLTATIVDTAHVGLSAGNINMFVEYYLSD